MVDKPKTLSSLTKKKCRTNTHIRNEKEDKTVVVEKQ